MGDVSVDSGATAKLGTVEGNLRVGEAARIDPEDKIIQVTGRVSCDGDAEFHGSLSCAEFSARHGKIRIEGDLNTKGEVKVDDGQLAVDGSLEATTVTVDKALRIGGNARADWTWVAHSKSREWPKWTRLMLEAPSTSPA